MTMPLLLSVIGKLKLVDIISCHTCYVFLKSECCLLNSTIWENFLKLNMTFCVFLCRMFYGPGGPYAKFAGRDASRALALLSFDPEDLTGNLEGLSENELEVLQDWEYKFMEKYKKVGQLVLEKTRTKEPDGGEEVEETANMK